MVFSLIALNKNFDYGVVWLLYLSKVYSQDKLIKLHHVSTSLVVHQNGQFSVFSFHEFNKCTNSMASNNNSDFQLLRMKIGLEFKHVRYAELNNFLQDYFNLKRKMACKKF